MNVVPLWIKKYTLAVFDHLQSVAQYHADTLTPHEITSTRDA